MGRTKTFSTDIEQQAIYNYVVLKQGLQTAGRQFGISEYMMKKILRDYSIPIRTYTEAKQEGRKYPCNDDFFKTQSPDMAYVLGFLAADGNVSKKENRIAINILAQDKAILEQIRTLTGITRPITSYIRKETGHEVCTLSNWSFTWKQDLEKYGIIPNKTYTLCPPTLLNPEYRIDYIRGFFDGDGCITQSKAKNIKGYEYSRTAFEISGASKSEIEWIYQELVCHYGVVLNKIQIEKTDNGAVMYKTITTKKDSLQRIYHLFYSTPSSLFLYRKKEKFETFLNIPRDSNSSKEE